MKFIALAALILCLVLSWRGTQRPGDIPTSVHFSLQTELENFIHKYISENVPTAKDIRFHRLWTKPIDIDTVDAQFEYSFVSQSEGEGTAKTQLSGSARLNRIVGAESNNEGWSLARVQIDDQTIEFEEGVLIKSDSSTPATEPTEPEGAAKPTEKASPAVDSHGHGH